MPHIGLCCSEPHNLPGTLQSKQEEKEGKNDASGENIVISSHNEGGTLQTAFSLNAKSPARKQTDTLTYREQTTCPSEHIDKQILARPRLWCVRVSLFDCLLASLILKVLYVLSYSSCNHHFLALWSFYHSRSRFL